MMIPSDERTDVSSEEVLNRARNESLWTCPKCGRKFNWDSGYDELVRLRERIAELEAALRDIGEHAVAWINERPQCHEVFYYSAETASRALQPNAGEEEKGKT